jgi:hypothetical protein
MKPPTTRLPPYLYAIAAAALIGLLPALAPARAQSELSLSFKSEYDVYATSNQSTQADYADNIVVTLRSR